MCLVLFQDEGLMPSARGCGLFHADQLWWPPAGNWGLFLILPQMRYKGYWELQQPGFQWTLGWEGVYSEMTSGMGGRVSSSMSTQVNRARGSSSTHDHLKLATADASPHHRPTYGCWEGQASPGALNPCQAVILGQTERIALRKCLCLCGLLKQMSSQMTNWK